MESANETVYIVDDEPAVREALSSLLRANGKRVRLFTSGGEFLLTPRERELLPLLVRGLLNKQAAAELGITEYTVQIHRRNIMRKMKADPFATLVRLAERLTLEQTLSA